jgi:hypothetical protein
MPASSRCTLVSLDGTYVRSRGGAIGAEAATLLLGRACHLTTAATTHARTPPPPPPPRTHARTHVGGSHPHHQMTGVGRGGRGGGAPSVWGTATAHPAGEAIRCILARAHAPRGGDVGLSKTASH